MPLNALSDASCTTSSASARLPVSQRASRYASVRCGRNTAAKRARSVASATPAPLTFALAAPPREGCAEAIPAVKGHVVAMRTERAPLVRAVGEGARIGLGCHHDLAGHVR